MTEKWEESANAAHAAAQTRVDVAARAESEAWALSVAEAAESARVEKRLLARGIPKHFAMKLAKRAIVEPARRPHRFSDEKPWLLLIGPPGTGKTHMACQLLAAAPHGRFVSWLAFLQARRSSISTREQDPMDDAMRAKLLVVDDLGRGSETDYSVATAETLLSIRYDAHRQTVITTTRSEAELNAIFGVQLTGRIFELAVGVATTKQWRKS